MAIAIAAVSASAAGDVQWGYSGELDQDHWGELSEAFRACSEGRGQSPIDIVDPTDQRLAPIELVYTGSTTTVVNNGHTLQIDVGPGNTLEIDDESFELVQFHLHSPSEHRVEGRSFSLEAHFVHQNERGELAVVGVLFREGAIEPGLAKIGASAPSSAGKSEAFVEPLDDLAILPNGRETYRYIGSLTTPPCTEGVRWLILEEIGSISPEQVENYVRLIGRDARDAQQLNGRQVVH
jgi:carbonic anhydrase